MNLVVDVPINNLSFGNVGVNILRELFNRQIPISLFPRGGQKDLSAFNKLPEDFKSWYLEESLFADRPLIMGGLFSAILAIANVFFKEAKDFCSFSPAFNENEKNSGTNNLYVSVPFIISIILMLIAGIYPSIKASKLDPVRSIGFRR